jgi:hypothetical protein
MPLSLGRRSMPMTKDDGAQQKVTSNTQVCRPWGRTVYGLLQSSTACC